MRICELIPENNRDVSHLPPIQCRVRLGNVHFWVLFSISRVVFCLSTRNPSLNGKIGKEADRVQDMILDWRCQVDTEYVPLLKEGVIEL